MFLFKRSHVQEAPHLAVQLPEIVTHILSHLCDNRRGTHGRYTDIHPCLLVNHLWYECAHRLLWRQISFEDSKQAYDRLLKLAAVLTPNASPEPNAFGPNGSAECAVSSYDESRAQDNRSQLPLLSGARNGEAIRSLSIRKIKNAAIGHCLSQIGMHTTRLQKLDIYICNHVSNWALQPFLLHGYIVHLSLAGCSYITDELILQVAETCPDLEHLDLRACCQVSDVSITAIANHCPKLRHLNVGRVRDGKRITDASICLIAQNTRINVLGLAGCYITDEGMQWTAKVCGQALERISVNNCPKIADGTVRALRQHCPSLFVFEMKECHLVKDWESVTALVQRKVLLTLCEHQNQSYIEWAHSLRKPIKASKLQR